MRRYRSALLLLAFAVPGTALAHVGQDAGIHHGSVFFQGFAHPFTGLDHLAAMVAIGIWSALTRQRIWLAPAIFAGLLWVGALLGAVVAIPFVEPMIAASLLVLGLLVAAQQRLAPAATAVLVGAFAIFHGAAHGAELPVDRAAVLAGIVAGTIVLHVAGLLIGYTLLKRSVWLPRVIGAALALFGVGLLSGAM